MPGSTFVGSTFVGSTFVGSTFVGSIFVGSIFVGSIGGVTFLIGSFTGGFGSLVAPLSEVWPCEVLAASLFGSSSGPPEKATHSSATAARAMPAMPSRRF